MLGFNMTCIDYSHYDGPLPFERKPCTDPRTPWAHDVEPYREVYIVDRMTGKEFFRDITIDACELVISRLADRYNKRFFMRIK
jgi:hypothetical protein